MLLSWSSSGSNGLKMLPLILILFGCSCLADRRQLRLSRRYAPGPAYAPQPQLLLVTAMLTPSIASCPRTRCVLLPTSRCTKSEFGAKIHGCAVSKHDLYMFLCMSADFCSKNEFRKINSHHVFLLVDGAHNVCSDITADDDKSKKIVIKWTAKAKNYCSIFWRKCKVNHGTHIKILEEIDAVSRNNAPIRPILEALRRIEKNYIFKTTTRCFTVQKDNLLMTLSDTKKLKNVGNNY